MGVFVNVINGGRRPQAEFIYVAYSTTGPYCRRATRFQELSMSNSLARRSCMVFPAALSASCSGVHPPSAASSQPMSCFERMAARRIPQTVFGVAGDDRLEIARAAVDDDAIRSAVALMGGSRKKRLAAGRSRCSLKKYSNVCRAVDCTIETHPLAAYFDGRLVHMPLEATRPI